MRVEAVRCVRACLLCGMERGGGKAYRLRVCGTIEADTAGEGRVVRPLILSAHRGSVNHTLTPPCSSERPRWTSATSS